MPRPIFLIAFAPVFALAQTPPNIVALQNNYSYTLPFAPNYGIAQGSIFIIVGNNLAGASTNLQTTYPLPTNLAGVNVTVNGRGPRAKVLLTHCSNNCAPLAAVP